MNFLLYRYLQSKSEEKLIKIFFSDTQLKILLNVVGKEELFDGNILQSLCENTYRKYSLNVAKDLNISEFPVSSKPLEETLEKDYPILISKEAKEIMLKAFEFSPEGDAVKFDVIDEFVKPDVVSPKSGIDTVMEAPTSELPGAGLRVSQSTTVNPDIVPHPEPDNVMVTKEVPSPSIEPDTIPRGGAEGGLFDTRPTSSMPDVISPQEPAAKEVSREPQLLPSDVFDPSQLGVVLRQGHDTSMMKTSSDVVPFASPP